MGAIGVWGGWRRCYGNWSLMGTCSNKNSAIWLSNPWWPLTTICKTSFRPSVSGSVEVTGAVRLLLLISDPSADDAVKRVKEEHKVDRKLLAKQASKQRTVPQGSQSKRAIKKAKFSRSRRRKKATGKLWWKALGRNVVAESFDCAISC